MARSITTRSTNPKIMDDNIKILDDALSVASTPPAENVSYDNTDSGLTADDVQSAIDEINAYDWVHIGSAGIGTEISLLNADYKEYFAAAVFGDNPTITINFFIPKGNLSSTPLHYISGSMATSQYGMQIELEATASYIKLVSIYRNGESVASGNIYVSGKYPA